MVGVYPSISVHDSSLSSTTTFVLDSFALVADPTWLSVAGLRFALIVARLCGHRLDLSLMVGLVSVFLEAHNL